MNNIITIIVIAIPLISLINIIFNYKKYQNILCSKNLSGCEVAHKILDANNISDVYIIEVRNTGFSHYDSSRKVIKLSSKVFHEDNIIAASIASFEASHAILDKEENVFFKIKNIVYPLIKVLNYFAYIVIVYGLLIQNEDTLFIGIALLLICLIFHLLTLPLEIIASSKAKKEIVKQKICEKHKLECSNILEHRTVVFLASIIFLLLDLIKSIPINKNRS